MTMHPLDLRLIFLPAPDDQSSALVQALAEAGFDVTAIQNAEAAPTRDAVRGADVVLIDSAWLSQWSWHSGDPPVVALVSRGNPGAAADALEAGAADAVALEKGADFIRLLRAVLVRAVRADRIARAGRSAADDAAAMRERAETLFTEIRHRIANSMALVVSVAHLQAATMPPGPGRQALQDFADRVLTIAQVHKGLYTAFNVGAVALDAYLGGVVKELQLKHAGRRALSRIVFEADPISGSVDAAISLGVILSELVGNAARYAYVGAAVGEVRVTLRRVDEREAVLMIEDDGGGIADGDASAQGLGSQLVAVLAHGLGGWFELRPRAQGTQAVLHFMIADVAEAATS